MPMPNFLVIGAAKSGTTAMFHALKQHPQIFMSPVKEPRFFALKGERPNYCGWGDEEFYNRRAVYRLHDYVRLFNAVRGQIALGEATTEYLERSDLTAAQIQRHIPHARLIAILRQPAERAYSHYIMARSQGRERLTFSAALAAEGERVRLNWASNWRLRGSGFYYRLLLPFFERFPREQIRVYLYEDWNSRPSEVLRGIYRFLNVDDAFLPRSARNNVSFLPRSHALQSLIRNSNPVKARLKLLLPINWACF